MRGGYRIGAGRPKGTKKKVQSGENAPKSEWTPEDKEVTRLLLSFDARMKDGGKLTRTELKQLDEIGKRLGPLTRAERTLMEEMVESFK